MSFRDRIDEIANDATLPEDKLRLKLKAALADCLDDNDVESYAGYTPAAQNILREQADLRFEKLQAWANYSHTESAPDRRPVHISKDGAIMLDSPAEDWFGWSRAGWLTIPRLSLQEMPIPWQAEFFRMLEEAERVYGLTSPDGTYVSLRRKGKFVSADHWSNYHHGSVQAARDIDNR